MGIVLQYTLVYCSGKGMRKAVCIAIQTECAGRGAGQALGTGGGAQELGVRGCWASWSWALAHGTGKRTVEASTRGARGSRRGARQGRAPSRLCTWCTRLVFDPV